MQFLSRLLNSAGTTRRVLPASFVAITLALSGCGSGDPGPDSAEQPSGEPSIVEAPAAPDPVSLPPDPETNAEGLTEMDLTDILSNLPATSAGGPSEDNVPTNPEKSVMPEISISLGNDDLEIPESSTRGGSDETEEKKESKEYHTVEIYYGTDRAPTESQTNNEHYSGERHREGPMEYGLATISIPLHHKTGIVERPKWYKLEFSEDPKKHVTIAALDKLEGKAFFESLKSAASSREKKEALLFIHGFNVAFDDAIRRTGQIAFDLDFGGVTLAYSWPSQGSFGAYTIDEANAQWSVPHLTQFLMDLQEDTDFEKIHIIAHSMGTRVLSRALANAKDEGFDLDFNNVILAAPDIDVDVFKDQILPKIVDSTDRLTMYASSDDTALKASQNIHGNGRLGLSGDDILVTEDMDTVNASGIDTSMIGHSYYGSHKVIVRDILNLVINGLDPVGRELTKGQFGEWDFGSVDE